ncbi:MAG: secretin N-terminal domain-containing protein [Gammaproteobacteria bacterium]|nr:secretin N-terminal domain-containing protein [Gammaproteobacteria bacterium]
MQTLDKTGACRHALTRGDNANGVLPRRRLAALIACALVLSSCAALDSSPRPLGPFSGRPDAEAGASFKSAAEVAAEEIAEIASPGSAQQQRLISEINRDGSQPGLSGYRETVPRAMDGDTPRDADDVVELNYEQADLRLVLEQLAESLDMSVVMDPSLDMKVSVRTSSNQPLGLDDVWPVMRLLARDAGVLIDRVGNVFNIRRGTSSLPIEIATPDTLGSGTAPTILQITPLVHVAADAAIEIIQPLLEGEGSVRRLLSGNNLAISAGESQLRRINELLYIVDSDPFANQGISLYPLSNASATEVATELEEILGLIEGATPAYQVKGIERINAVLVTAPARRGFDEIARWIQILDAASQEQVEQLFHYRVKNLSATELGDTLSSVFESNDSRDEDEDGNRGRNGRDEQPVVFEPPSGNPDGQQDPAQSGLAANDGARPTNPSNAIAANLAVKIVADEATNSLLIRSTARDYRQLLTTINQLDAVPLQVMINAVIAQITLTEGNEFGVDWSRVAADSAVQSLSTSTSTNYTPAGLGGLMFSKSFIDGAAQVDATLEAISVNNDVQLLARPSLTVINNQEGEIQIGSQVPVEQGQAIGGAGISTTNIQYRDTGIVLSITPQINDDGIVNLIIRQELSSVDSGAEGVNNNPVFNNQEINTTVVVRDGENVVLGGLIQSDTENLNTGVPGLNRVPLLGGLFSFRQQSVQRKELFIVLRPEIVDLNADTSSQYRAVLERFELATQMIEEAGI